MHSKKLISLISFFTISTLFIASSQIALANSFSDLTSDHPNYEAILYLKEHGIIDGYEDGTVKPDIEITRAELLKILVEAVVLTPETLEYNRCFTDVEVIEWYTRYICYAKSQGWVEGYEDGTFRPGNTINNIEVLAMTFDSQELFMEKWYTITNPFDDVDASSWYGPYVAYAKDNGIIDRTNNLYNPGELITRGDAFEILYRTLFHIEELSKPVTYTEGNLTLQHTQFYEMEKDPWMEGSVIFTNINDDGIAFIDEATFDELTASEGFTIEEVFALLEGKLTDISIKRGRVENVLEFNEFIDQGEGMFFFKVLPQYGNSNGYYVVGHYTSDEARLEVLDMIHSIEVN